MNSILPRYVFVGWILFSLVLLLMPTGQTPVVDFTYIDKVVHFGLFFVLGSLMMLAAPDRRSRLTWFLFGIFYAVVTEILQGVVPWDRSPSVYDVMANLAGLTTGALLVLLWLKRRQEVAAG